MNRPNHWSCFKAIFANRMQRYICLAALFLPFGVAAATHSRSRFSAPLTQLALLAVIWPVVMNASYATTDIQVQSVSVPGAAPTAGEKSTVRVMFTNAGNETLSGDDYSFRVRLSENPPGRVGGRCEFFNPDNWVSYDYPDVEPGQRQTHERRFTFRQAGTFTLQAEARTDSNQDPRSNNTIETPVTVGLPRPLVCGVSPLTGKGGTQTAVVWGDWFKTFNTTEVPTVQFNGVIAPVVAVPSTMEVEVQQPLICNSDPVELRVTNATGTTTRQERVDEALQITGITTTLSNDNRAFLVQIGLAGFRNRCPTRVEFAPGRRIGNVALGSAFAPAVILTTPVSVLVRVSNTGRPEEWVITVATGYGSPSRTHLFSGPGRRPPDRIGTP